MEAPAPTLIKYPSTMHIVGSGLQKGDSKQRVGWKQLAGTTLAVETKIDGSNVGISFDASGNLQLQSRGDYLRGGDKHHFDQFKVWASVHQMQLHEILADRYIMYGEWMAAKHSVYYDLLPHLFMEFDIYDRDEQVFLDSAARHAMLEGSCVVSVPIRHYGLVTSLDELLSYARASERALYKSESWVDNLVAAGIAAGYSREPHPTRIDIDDLMRETDQSNADEGLYIKQEAGGIVTGRYKWVRPGFVQTITDSGSHWDTRAHVPNALVISEDVLWDPQARDNTYALVQGIAL